MKPDGKKKEPQVAPRQCPHCQHINPPVTSWCYGCGESLDPTSVATEDQIKQFIIHHGKELGEFLTNFDKAGDTRSVQKD